MRQSYLTCLRLVRTDAASIDGLERTKSAHPTVRVDANASDALPSTDVTFDVAGWTASRDFLTFDRAVEASQTEALSIRGAGRDLARVAGEVLTRYQRWIDRRNAASDTLVFDAVLAAHRALHDCSKPLVRADLDHALDTWQWVLRLAPDASLAVQLAALFHDVERLESEADRRVEHHAPDYQAFKDAHARRGGELASEVLRQAGIDEATTEKVRTLVSVHERRSDDPDVALLVDADGLSFFSLNSPGYVDYFGLDQAARKVRWTLARLGPPGLRELARVKLRPDVAELLRTAGSQAGRGAS